MIEYTLLLSRRKTVSIYVRGETVEVRAPLRTAKKTADRLVEENKAWILNRLEAEKIRTETRSDFRLDYGSFFLYRGKEYKIAKGGVKLSAKGALCEDSFYLPPDLSSEKIKIACVKLYRTLAKSDIIHKVNYYSEIMGVQPSSVKINGAKTRWGSCSARKSLNFSWRLITANDGVIDYVVVHELAHIKEMNHSKRFWAAVESVLPDYRERRRQLKEVHLKLDAEDWE